MVASPEFMPVKPHTGFNSKGRLLGLPANILPNNNKLVYIWSARAELTQVEPLFGLKSKGRLLPLTPNIRLGWKWLTVVSSKHFSLIWHRINTTVQALASICSDLFIWTIFSSYQVGIEPTPIMLFHSSALPNGLPLVGEYSYNHLLDMATLLFEGLKLQKRKRTRL